MVNTTLDRVATAPLPAPAHIGQATAVEQARAVAEVAAAVQVAQMNPRDIRRAWADMQEACGRLGLANRAFYSVRNRGTGPSVHLARELARIWGNMDYGVHELHRDDTRGMSEIRAYAWDQQTNVRSSRTFQVPHARMANGQRKPLTDLQDIYLSNQNIGARAVREAIFAALPADFVEEAKDRCRATVERGDGKPLVDRIAAMVDVFKGVGVTVAQIEARLGRKRGQWTAVDVADLSVVFSSIKRSETTIEEEFPPQPLTGAEILQANAAVAPATVEEAAPVSGAPASNGRVPSAAQKRDIEDLARQIGVDGGALPAYLSELVGRDVPSVDALSSQDARQAITRMQAYLRQQEPPAEGGVS